MKTVKKTIKAGRKLNDDKEVVNEWAEGFITMQSFADIYDDVPVLVIANADNQLLHHQASTAYRSHNGDLTKLGNEPGTGLFYFVEGVLMINEKYVPGKSGSSRISEIVASAKRMASLLAKADPENAVEPDLLILQGGYTKSDTEKALKLLSE